MPLGIDFAERTHMKSPTAIRMFRRSDAHLTKSEATMQLHTLNYSERRMARRSEIQIYLFCGRADFLAAFLQLVVKTCVTGHSYILAGPNANSLQPFSMRSGMILLLGSMAAPVATKWTARSLGSGVCTLLTRMEWI